MFFEKENFVFQRFSDIPGGVLFSHLRDFSGAFGMGAVIIRILSLVLFPGQIIYTGFSRLSMLKLPRDLVFFPLFH